MKEAVLALLRSKQDYVSGQAMSRHMGKSRTAIWHAMEELRDLGYEIEASPRKGYRLVAPPDRLFPWEVAPYLNTKWLGRPIEHYMSVSSTNDLLKQMAKEGAPEGLVVVAEEQTQGKGRRGRSWSSPAGRGIWCSALLRPSLPPHEAPKMALLAALATANAIEAVTSLKAGVKWPNDVLVDGKKVAGILVEMDAEIEQVRFLIVGVGINVNMSMENLPPQVHETASSLEMASGVSVNRSRLLARYLKELEDAYCTWQQHGFEVILGRLRQRTITLGHEVSVIENSGTWQGVAHDIASDGSLLVRTSDGRIRPVYAAEVSLRPGRP